MPISATSASREAHKDKASCRCKHKSGYPLHPPRPLFHTARLTADFRNLRRERGHQRKSERAGVEHRLGDEPFRCVGPLENDGSGMGLPFVEVKTMFSRITQNKLDLIPLWSMQA
jgi:hypothetical protein